MKKTLFLLSLLAYSCSSLAQGIGSCKDSSYRKSFYLLSDTIKSAEQIATSDNGNLLAGKCISAGTGNTTGLAIKLNDQAVPVWAKRFSTAVAGEQVILKRCMQLSDGSYIFGGRIITTQYGLTNNILLLKTDASGNITWQKRYDMDPVIDAQPDIALMNISEGNNGDILAVASVGGNLNNNFGGYYNLLLRTDKDGNAVYSTIFAGQSGALSTFSGVFLYNNRILIWGFSDDGTCPDLDPRSIFNMQLNYSDGAVMASARYCFTTTAGFTSYAWSPYRFIATETDSGFVVTGSLAEGGTARMVCNVSFDNNLQLRSGFTANNARSLPFWDLLNVFNDGRMTYMSRNQNNALEFYLSTVNASGHILQQRGIPATGGQFDVLPTEGGRRISARSNSLAFTMNHVVNNQPVIEFFRLQTSDTGVCLGADTSFGLSQPFPVNASPLSWNRIITNPLQEVVVLVSSEDVTILSGDICKQVNSCTTAQITGPDTVCVLGQGVNYIVHRNPGCRQPVTWQTDTASCRSFTILNDSTISIVWKMRGPGVQSGYLKAFIETCTGIKDSIGVTLIPFINPMPDDSLLCAGDSIRLRVGSWFKTYTWQDGSADSVMIARAPGKYWVRVQSWCGYASSDTITISVRTAQLLSDDVLNRCNNDSLVIKAAPGFTHYSWTPLYDMRQESDSVIRVWPFADTSYIVNADIGSGCLISDTIKVDVKMSPVVDLGNDTSVCDGTSILIKSSNEFVRYLWNTGSVASSILVTEPGAYILQVTDDNGCKGRDSIAVSARQCSNKIIFPNAFSPNGDGKNDLFRPYVQGPLTLYELNIYNQWGQMVFHNTDSRQGWNGTANGKAQAIGTFIWICRYRFAGESLKVEKGVLILVK